MKKATECNLCCMKRLGVKCKYEDAFATLNKGNIELNLAGRVFKIHCNFYVEIPISLRGDV